MERAARPVSREHRRLVLTFVAASLAFLLPAIGIVRTSASIPKASRWVEQTRIVLVHLERLSATVDRADGWHHDYLILGEADALTAFERAAGDVEPAFARASSAMAENLGERRRLEEVAPLVAEWLQRIRRLVAAKKSGGVRDLPRRLAEERATKKALQEALERIHREERSLLTQRLDALHSQSALILAFTVTGAALTLIMLAWGARLSLRDLDRRIALDEMHQDLTHHVNHELRGPSTSVAMAFSLLKNGGPPLQTEQAEIVDLGLGAAEHLKRMVDDLLDVTRLETGKLRVEPSRVDLRPVLEESVLSMNGLARSRGVDLEFCLPPTLFASADCVRIRQVAVNLLDNALKFTPAGGAVAVSAEPRGETVRVTVRDTGPGIPAEDLERVFDRLFQSARTAKQSAKGLGLGLAVCREIIARHNGRIWAESSPGRGASLVFELPAA